MNKKRLLRGLFAAFMIAATTGLFLKYHDSAEAFSVVARPAPEFNQTSPETWLNSPPLSMADLRGKVVLIDFWTFGCWNCYRSFPWLNDLEQRLADREFQVIGIHTPEFDHEKDRSRVEAKIAEFGLKHPSMLDNDFFF